MTTADARQRIAARAAVIRAEHDGLLTRPGRCADCNCVAVIEAHHTDYDRPLDVEWLCQSCHPEADWFRRCSEDLPSTSDGFRVAACRLAVRAGLYARVSEGLSRRADALELNEARA